MIIAEAGVNHNGDEGMAFALVDAAINSGADAIKFQTFKSEKLVTKNALKANYQTKTTSKEESQLDMLKNLELSYASHHKLLTYCNNNNIEFISTAFDLESLNFLVNDLNLNKIKISSGELTNAPLLLAHAQAGCELIVSTGMSTLDEIEESLGVIAYGFLGGQSPSKKSFKEAFNSDEGKSILNEKVTLLHCTTEYPAPLGDINLNAMQTMKSAFNLKVGYSDHSEGINVPIAATALGATIIEKHFTLDKTLPGPDHIASLDPNELAGMVRAIRIVENIMGDGLKMPMPSELANKKTARKSLVAAVSIKKGDVFTDKNITSKRPGMGISPIEYWGLLGTLAKKSYSRDDFIET